MKISNSSVFISGIDDVEKVFSYPHPAVKQMDYQVEVPELAHSAYTNILTGCRKAAIRNAQHATHSGYSKRSLRISASSPTAFNVKSASVQVESLRPGFFCTESTLDFRRPPGPAR
jgi:hypothetical protein